MPDTAADGPRVLVLVTAACVPFGVMGLLALPLALSALRHLTGM